jgi:hypothetical protein
MERSDLPAYKTINCILKAPDVRAFCKAILLAGLDEDPIDAAADAKLAADMLAQLSDEILLEALR